MPRRTRLQKLPPSAQLDTPLFLCHCEDARKCHHVSIRKLRSPLTVLMEHVDSIRRHLSLFTRDVPVHYHEEHALSKRAHAAYHPLWDKCLRMRHVKAKQSRWQCNGATSKNTSLAKSTCDAALAMYEYPLWSMMSLSRNPQMPGLTKLD